MEIGRNHLFFDWNYVNITANGATPSVNIFNPEGSPPIIIPKGTGMRSNINMNIYSLIWTRTIFNKKVSDIGVEAAFNT